MSVLLTLSVVLTWLALAIAFAGIGACFLRRAVGVEPSPLNFYYSIWIGIALTTLALMAWHFAWPIRSAMWPFIGTAAAAVLAERRAFAPLSQMRTQPLLVLGSLAVIIWSANHCLDAAGMDDYNYEFQSVRWFLDYPLLPGLANVHGRIGFNNAHHLLAALIAATPWAERVHHLLNGFFVSLTLAYVLWALASLRSTNTRPTLDRVFAAMLCLPIIGLVLFGTFGPAISTLKADVLVTAGQAFLACIAATFATTLPRSQDARAAAATAILVGCFLVSVKLSAIVFCGLVLIFIVVRSWLDDRNQMSTQQLRLAIPAVAGAIIIAGYLARGIVLSGYPLYPSTAFGVNVDWQLPAIQAQGEWAYVKTFSQGRPAYDVAAALPHDWVPAWITGLLLNEKFSLLLPLVIIVTLIGAFTFRRRAESRPPIVYPLLIVIGIASIAAWMITAPAARFGAIYFWIIAAAILTMIHAQAGMHQPRQLWTALMGGIAAAVATLAILHFCHVDRQWHLGIFFTAGCATLWAIAFIAARGRTNRVFALCAALAVAQIGARAASHLARGNVGELAAMAWLNVTRWPGDQARAIFAQQTKSGLTVYVAPISTFNTPLPNTRYFNPDLELRTANDMRGGFRNPARTSVTGGYAFADEAHPIKYPAK